MSYLKLCRNNINFLIDLSTKAETKRNWIKRNEITIPVLVVFFFLFSSSPHLVISCVFLTNFSDEVHPKLYLKQKQKKCLNWFFFFDFQHR